jgi:hypothetical protein
MLGILALKVSRDFEPRQRKPEQSFSRVGIGGIVRDLDAAVSIASASSRVDHRQHTPPGAIVPYLLKACLPIGTKKP